MTKDEGRSRAFVLGLWSFVAGVNASASGWSRAGTTWRATAPTPPQPHGVGDDCITPVADDKESRGDDEYREREPRRADGRQRCGQALAQNDLGRRSRRRQQR